MHRIARGAGGVWVVAPGLVGGCAPVDDEIAPELEDARFEDASTVVLTFSEPLASVDDIDPASHFRLASGFALEALDQTIYYDLSHHFPYGVPVQGGDASGTWPRHGFTTVTRVEQGDDPAQLRLTLDYPLEHYVCDILVAAEAMGIPAGIHLHYAEAGFPRVTDEAGNPLAEFGAQWASVFTTRDGQFPELDPRISIPCPELP